MTPPNFLKVAKQKFKDALAENQSVQIDSLEVGDLFCLAEQEDENIELFLFTINRWGGCGAVNLTTGEDASIHHLTKVIPFVPKHKERTIITIGELGYRRAYIDVPLDAAKHRFAESEGTHPDDSKVPVKEYKIKDEFWTYEVAEP